jgi:hypothetical protein
MAGETETPNIGLQIPAFNQPNWQVPLNYDLNLLDQIFGGEVQVPGLWVDTLQVTNFVITNLVASLAASFVMEAPVGDYPGTIYQTTYIPGLIMGVYYNGSLLRPIIDYSVSGNQITTMFTTGVTGVIYVLYFH